VAILLLRHCQTDWNLEPARCQGWADVGLNAAGRAQALECARVLEGRGLELIVTSHLLRARETAAIVRDGLGGDLPMVADPRVAETHRGDWEQRLFDEIVEEDAVAWRHYREYPETFRFPGGESLAEQQRRVLAALRDVACDGRRTLIVTHGGCIRLVRGFLSGRGIADFHDSGTPNGGIDEVPEDGLVARIATALAGRRRRRPGIEATAIPEVDA
jgi:probable phosphoglycerate mutase